MDEAAATAALAWALHLLVIAGVRSESRQGDPFEDVRLGLGPQRHFLEETTRVQVSRLFLPLGEVYVVAMVKLHFHRVHLRIGALAPKRARSWDPVVAVLRRALAAGTRNFSLNREANERISIGG